tara:strand:+ start:2342 stop:3028 length:687 start_codon:yes stop_codon:yes gene_type:complete
MKLYTFGDSWTRNREFYQKEYFNTFIEDTSNKPWNELLSIHYNLTLVNLGASGGAPQTIVNRLIKQLDAIEENSTVVVSLSALNRVTIPIFKEDNLIELFVTHKPLQWFERKKFKLNLKESNLSEEVYNSAVQFSTNVLYPLYNNYQRYYFDQVKSLLLFLQSTKNIKFLFWNWEYTVHTKTDQFYIDRIVDHTKGKVNDLHPSSKGHNQLFNYFKNAIDSNTEYLWF